MNLKFLHRPGFYIGILAIGLIGISLLLVIDKLIMPAYTSYNEGVTVPDVTRKSLQEAEAVLASSGLRFEISDRRSNAAFPADYVIDQTPAPSLIVKPNRKIYLTVNTATTPQVAVPNVENLSFRNAQIQLQNYGLVVGVVSYESSRFKTVVLKQSLPKGRIVPKGTRVDLVVSDGLGDKKVTIPELIGLRLPDAQLKLREVGLRLGEIRFKPEKDIVPNIVLDYEPKLESIVEGESIHLVVSQRFNALEEIEAGAIIEDSTRTTPPDSLRIPNKK